MIRFSYSLFATPKGVVFFYIISCRCQTSDFFKEYNPAAASIQQVENI